MLQFMKRGLFGFEAILKNLSQVDKNEMFVLSFKINLINF